MTTHLTHKAVWLDWPADLAALFGRSAPLIVEIGFGGGTFLLALAQQHPDSNILGIETAHYSLNETEGRLTRHPRPNVRLIDGDAVMTFAYLLPPESIDALFINFPDPFPKTGHAHRRLLTAHSLALFTSRLKPGAPLTIATDVRPYAESIAADLAVTRGLANTHKTAWIDAIPGRTVTRYERKARTQGVTPHYFEWRRDFTTIELPAIPTQPPREEADLSNIVIQSTLTLDQIQNAFERQNRNEGEVHIRLLDAYQDARKTEILIDTFVDEPYIEQRLGIAIAARGERFVVRLAPIGVPRATTGTHLAVRFVAEWLKTLDPALTVLHDNATPDHEPA